MSELQRITILIVGDGGVGKTTFMNRSQGKGFSSTTGLTVGADFFEKKIKIQEKEIKIIVLDTGGQERFLPLHESNIKGISGAFLMFDLTRFDTLSRPDFWISEVVRKYNKELPILLLGNKADLEDEIVIENDYIKELMGKYNLFNYLIVSSMTGLNIEKAFELLITEILNHQNIEGGATNRNL
ncbi:MAG: Rab family GTPase [Candidatus Hodarchaeota archaeon]